MNTRWVALSLFVAIGCDASAYDEPLDDTDHHSLGAPGDVGVEEVEPAVETSPDVGHPDAIPATLHFAADLSSALADDIDDEFAILDQRDVVAVFSTAADTEIHVLKIQITQPSGHRYQTIWRAYSTDPSAPPFVSDPVAIPLERVAPAGERVVIPIGIPIAGTDIARFRLAGLYTVEAYLDGELAAENAFELTLF
jgi:hypothetical protein